MIDPALLPMTADAFLAWSIEQPEGERYELVAGRVVRMASERATHARTKFTIARRLAEAVELGGLNCEVFGDGMSVVVDDHTIYEPDAQLRCGPRLADDAIKVFDPVVVVEVVSPSSRAIDNNAKLVDYFRIATVRHSLVVLTASRTIIHHSRAADGAILARIVRDGPIELDPPGISLSGIFE